MSVLRDILDELLSMFLGDARLSLAILAVVAAAAALVYAGQPWLAGAVLLLGCVGLMLGSVILAARKAGAGH
ncbi:MAG TPA: hypothetical protein VMU08_04050 [Rhizomicrobium sp.]|nr:hypothetical protein [Rhizomicrobium sp.]